VMAACWQLPENLFVEHSARTVNISPDEKKRSLPEFLRRDLSASRALSLNQRVSLRRSNRLWRER
jgi:hypothetical protein